MTTETIKTIETLVEDIKSVLERGVEIKDDHAKEFGTALAKLIVEKLSPSNREKKGTLRMSNIGAPDRKLWYTVNMPDAAEDLDGSTYLKFLIGDIYEAVLLFLAKQAGHRVTHEQHEVNILGVKGHPDAVIDGQLVDVKSASGYGMKKFKDNGLLKDDPFNYLDQINSYRAAMEDDPGLVIKDKASFLAADKSSGELLLDTYPVTETKAKFEKFVESKIDRVLLKTPPDRCYPAVPDGASGNMKLGTECSYCVFKKTCWPNLRTFIYSNGPRFLTHVARQPDVPEVK